MKLTKKVHKCAICGSPVATTGISRIVTAYCTDCAKLVLSRDSSYGKCVVCGKPLKDHKDLPKEKDLCLSKYCSMTCQRVKGTLSKYYKEHKTYPRVKQKSRLQQNVEEANRLCMTYGEYTSKKRLGLI